MAAMETRRSILVVEDEEFLREGIVTLLEDAGWMVMQAPDGAAALEIFRVNPIEVVLSDILMPRMDGIQLLRAIQEIDPDVPAVVLTGYGSIERCVAALQAGAVDFLGKPFEDEHLLAAVDRAWRGRGHYKENETLLRQSHCKFEMTMPPDMALVFSTAARVEAVSRPLGYYRRRWAIRRALEEALKNAIAHGATDAKGTIRIEAEIDGSAMTIAVEDPGKGFPISEAAADRTEIKGARGIFLIRSFSDEARWIEPGNRVEMVFHRRGN